MSRLFISHSSQNNPEAAAVNLWLKEQGWDDVFLDVTPDRGIAAGERWERALNEAASRCEVVLFLVSRGWIASRWCRKEYELARRLNKRLLGALIEIIPVEELPGEITDTFQMVDLASGSDHRMFRVELPRTHEEVHVTFSREGLFRLKDGLNKAGLDPRFFPWPPDHDPGRAPYRGLKPLEQEDAGIFFGREAPIVEGLDMLRGLAEMAPPRLFVILGASGAGKSSYLRAGLLPRLARDDRTFLSLPVIRPEGGAVSGETGLLAAIEGAFQTHGIAQSRAAMRQAIARGGEALKPLLAQLSAKVFSGMVTGEAPKPPAITIAIDQAEEIFSDGEGEQLLALIRDLVTGDEPEVIVLFTIRSDAYDHLETTKTLEGLRQRTLALLPMPRGAYQTVIEGPAARLSGTNRPLSIEPRLTQRLLQDIERGGGSDALPLLAFTLGQLYVDFGGSGTLSLADYEEFGGIQGAIEAAVRRVMLAADRDPRVPKDPDARLLLMRRGLIPWLAGIDPDTGSPRRRLARLSDIPADAEPLVRLLVEQRLLSVDRITVKENGGERTEITVEPAHEALLRQWGLLRGWLDEDFAALAVLDGVKRGARDWEANARGPEWLSHTGTRLAEAEAIAARPDLGGILSHGAADYLVRCRERDDAEARARAERLENERQLKDSQVRLAEADKVAAEQKAQATRRFMRLAIAATVAVALGLAAAGGLAVLNHFQARERDDAIATAEAGRWVAKSQGELRDDNAAAAVRSAYRAYRDRPREETRSALLTALLDRPELVGTYASSDPAQALVWLPDGSLGFASRGAALRSLVLPGQKAGPGWPSPAIDDLSAGHAMVRAFRFTHPDWLLAAMSDGGVVGWGREGRLTTGLKPGDGVVWAAAIGPNGRRIARVEAEGTSIVTCGGERPDRPACSASRIVEDPALSVAIDEAEKLVAVGGEDGRLTLYDAAGVHQGEPIELGSPVTALSLAPRGNWVAAGTQAGEIAVFDVASREPIVRTAPMGRPVTALAFRPRNEPDTVDLAVSCSENAACLMRLLREPRGGWALAPAVRLPGHKSAPRSLVWTADGAKFGAAYADGLIRVWTPFPAADVIGARWRAREPGRLSRVVPAPGGDLVAAAGDRQVTIFDRRTGGVVRTLRLKDGLDPRALAFAPDGRLAVVYEEGYLAIWPASGEGEPALRHWDATANPGLAWLDGGRLLAVALSDGRIALVDPAGVAADVFLPSIGPGADAWGLAASPDGKALYASYVKGEIRRWDVAAKTHAVLRAASPDLPAAERSAPESLAISPDGRRLAVTGDDEAVRLFEAAGARRRVLGTESPSTRAVAFSPDGERLAALGTDGRVYVWSGAKGEGDPVRELSFEPSDGSARSATSRPASWITWADPGTILAAVGDAVQVVPLDEAAWRRRAESLDLRPAEPK